MMLSLNKQEVLIAMKILRGMGKIAKPLVNFPKWMGWRQISVTGHTIKELGKDLWVKPTAKRQETFEQARQRLQLREQDVQQRAKFFLRMTWFYVSLAFVLFIYSSYLLWTAHFAAAFLSFILTVLALALAFRQHFWYFQIQRRQLGCTLKQWVAFTFRGRES